MIAKPIIAIISPSALLLERRDPFTTGCSLPTATVALGPALEQLSDPHVHPLGQHCPPTSAAQVAQPLAQLPLAVVVASGTLGTTTVFPALIMVMEAVDGQKVCAQSLPIRQQPAPG